MTPTRLSRLPVLLRQEPYGGLLFCPEDAVHIEVDHEAFAFLRDRSLRRRGAQTPEEEDLLRRVGAETGRPEGFEAKVVECSREGPPYPFEVLSAPTLADFSITERCTLSCPHCYASSGLEGADVSLEDIELVLRELSANGVFQIALGGGEPLVHPQLIEILELCHVHHLVPNVTTSGLFLNRERTLAALEGYCGAVALSLEAVGEKFEARRGMSFAVFRRRLELLLDRGIPTVLQITLSQESLPDLDEVVDFCLEYPALYGVIFLAYKEVGRGADYDHALTKPDPAPVHQGLRSAFQALSGQARVGYDCCLTPAIIGMGLEPDQRDHVDGCSALRGSIGISTNLDVVPCTFASDIVIGNLRHDTLRDIWSGERARAFRGRMRQRVETGTPCSGCPDNRHCLAGCQVFELARCHRRGTAPTKQVVRLGVLRAP